MEINYKEGTVPNLAEVKALYSANKWSSAENPDRLINALKNSHHLVTAYDNEGLIGLANSISDGHLVVYYPHLLVHPRVQGYGIGKEIMNRMLTKYSGMHQHMLTAVNDAIGFYEHMGFSPANGTTAMWIYHGADG